MVDIKFNTVEDVNEELKRELGKLLFTGYNSKTDEQIEKIFKDVAIKSAPQSLILEDIQFFDHDLKIEYQCQNRHFSMILSHN
ncbi:MAG: hypothetical protein J6T10_04255 [Methanobrevibacter sp.]|nr:hypothetical protein [Methanobrevibacter sp.]